MSDATVQIEINGKPFEARKGAMVIEVADAAGISIPRFCYHKKLSVAANCRMCLVEVEKAPKPLPACATPVMDGMKVHTRSKLALGAQRSVMEFLLINHPLDCPICDQGGECELQDVAMGYGRDLTRFTERKRVVKDKDIGPLIATDMTRCIHCTRCVRFGEEIGGMPELGATGRGEHMEIGTYIEKAVVSELSGNVIDLCPVGALTSKPFRFRARAWEMRQREALAPHDAVGSNLHVHVLRDRVMRVVPRENEAINEVWISDRDRFAYQGLYGEDRLTTPMVKRDGEWHESDWESALARAAEGIREAGARVGALLSPHATLEELYLAQRWLRGIGCANIDHRLRESDFTDQHDAPPFPWLGMAVADVERLGAVLLVGANPRRECPIVGHRLRKATLAGGQVMILSALDEPMNFGVAQRIVASPADLETELAAIAVALGDAPAALAGIEPRDDHRAIAERLRGEGGEGRPTALLLGALANHHPRAAALRALARHIAAASGATCGTLPEAANSAGAWIAGALPHRRPGGHRADPAGLDASAMLDAGLSAFVLLGVEPELDCAGGARAARAMREAGFVLSLTAWASETMREIADVLLPIGAFAESSGTFVNMAGAWQSAAGAVPPPGEARPAWKVLRVLANLCELEGFDYVDSESVLADVRAEAAGLEPAAPVAVALSAPERARAEGVYRIGVVPMYASDPLVRRASALQSTTQGRFRGLAVNADLAARLGVGEGDIARIAQNGASAEAPVVIDDGVPAGCVELAAGVAQTASIGPMFGPVEITKA